MGNEEERSRHEKFREPQTSKRLDNGGMARGTTRKRHRRVAVEPLRDNVKRYHRLSFCYLLIEVETVPNRNQNSTIIICPRGRQRVDSAILYNFAANIRSNGRPPPLLMN